MGSDDSSSFLFMSEESKKMMYNPTSTGLWVLRLALILQLTAWILTWFSNPNSTKTLAICWPAWGCGLGAIVVSQWMWFRHCDPEIVFWVSGSATLVTAGLSFGLCGGYKSDNFNTLGLIQSILWLLTAIIIVVYVFLERKQVKKWKKECKEAKAAKEKGEPTPFPKQPEQPATASADTRLQELEKIKDHLTADEYADKRADILSKV